MSKHLCPCCNGQHHKSKEKRKSNPKEKQPFYVAVSQRRKGAK